MKVAVVDLGTNTFELLIADIGPNAKWDPITSEEQPVFLGKGGIEKGQIAGEALERALNCLSNFSQQIEMAGCSMVRCIATSALRNAKNSVEVVDTIYARAGLRIEIIDGDQEATFIAKGTALAMKDLHDPYVVMDIGGGSTEFAIMHADQVLFKKSIEIGATRLLERHGISDPIDPKEIAEMNRSIQDGFAPILDEMGRYSAKILVGGSGTFDSFKAMLNTEQKGAIAEYDLTSLMHLLRSIIGSVRSDRRAMSGLADFRVDTIVPSALMVEHFINAGVEQIYWSGYALKEGVMQEIAEEISPA